MIRPAIHSDIPALIDMVMEFFANNELEGTGLIPDADTIEFFMQDLIDVPGHVVLVAEVAGEIIGAIAGGVMPWMFNANIMTLMELGWFVPKRNREKHGIAMKLRNTFHKWGKEQGASVLVMVSTKREESPRVMAFYEKSGLKHIDSNFIGRL